jgi:hypothetical protein
MLQTMNSERATRRFSRRAEGHLPRADPVLGAVIDAVGFRTLTAAALTNGLLVELGSASPSATAG